MNNKDIEEIKRLNFEDIIWVLFAILAILNLIGDNYQKKYIYDKNLDEDRIATNIFTFTIVVSIIINFYFLDRNYKAYNEVDFSNKRLYGIKLLSSLFFIFGGLCLLYFQKNDKNNFIGGSTL